MVIKLQHMAETMGAMKQGSWKGEPRSAPDKEFAKRLRGGTRVEETSIVKTVTLLGLGFVSGIAAYAVFSTHAEEESPQQSASNVTYTAQSLKASPDPLVDAFNHSGLNTPDTYNDAPQNFLRGRSAPQISSVKPG